MSMDDDRHAPDIGPDNGVLPPQAAPVDTGPGAGGPGEGYSGQEYASKGQAAWRAEQQRRNAPADGVARGTGSPGEDFDQGTPGGGDPDGPPT